MSAAGGRGGAGDASIRAVDLDAVEGLARLHRKLQSAVEFGKRRVEWEKGNETSAATQAKRAEEHAKAAKQAAANAKSQRQQAEDDLEQAVKDLAEFEGGLS